ncbi:putative transmembrane protein, partial [Rhizoctonia solani 123E]
MGGSARHNYSEIMSSIEDPLAALLAAKLAEDPGYLQQIIAQAMGLAKPPSKKPIKVLKQLCVPSSSNEEETQGGSAQVMHQQWKYYHPPPIHATNHLLATVLATILATVVVVILVLMVVLLAMVILVVAIALALILNLIATTMVLVTVLVTAAILSAIRTNILVSTAGNVEPSLVPLLTTAEVASKVVSEAGPSRTRPTQAAKVNMETKKTLNARARTGKGVQPTAPKGNKPGAPRSTNARRIMSESVSSLDDEELLQEVRGMLNKSMANPTSMATLPVKPTRMEVEVVLKSPAPTKSKLSIVNSDTAMPLILQQGKEPVVAKTLKSKPCHAPTVDYQPDSEVAKEPLRKGKATAT